MIGQFEALDCMDKLQNQMRDVIESVIDREIKCKMSLGEYELTNNNQNVLIGVHLPRFFTLNHNGVKHNFYPKKDLIEDIVFDYQKKWKEVTYVYYSGEYSISFYTSLDYKNKEEGK